jgi:hypothetical protein
MAPCLVYLYSRCPDFLSPIILLIYNMPNSLAEFPTEIICDIVKALSLNNTRNFLSCSSSVHEPRKYAFNKNCFRVLLVRLSYDGLLKAKELIRIE